MPRALVWLSAVAVAAAVLVVAAGSARAQLAAMPASGLTAGPNIDGDASVTALAVGSGDVLYVGGSFSRLAARTGHWVRFDALGARDKAWPDVDGSVYAAAPDGVGGWFIGGRFTHIGGQSQARLAHVGADGQLNPAWRPAVSGRARIPHFTELAEPAVTALCVVGDTLYVGGLFASVNGQPRKHLAAVSARTGELLPWNPRPNSEVDALAAGSGTAYVGGGFTRIGSVNRGRLAAFDTATGALTAWNPGVAGRVREATDPWVTALVLDRGRLYVGGRFTEVGGRDRLGLAAFDVATGALTPWNTSFVEVFALAVAGDTVYADGIVSADEGLGVFDAHTGRLLPWRPEIDDAESSPAGVYALTVVGDRLYVGGDFTSLAEQRRKNLGAVNATTGAPLEWDPRPSNEVYSLVAAGDGVLVGGDFSGLDSQPRDGLAAIQLATGALLPFDPHLLTPDYGQVNAIAPHGRTVFAAGYSYTGPSVAKLDAQTGRAQHWNASVNSSASLHALAVDGHTLYVGGDFGRIGGRRRHNLAALDTRTGRATRWRMDANRAVSALAIDGHTLYLTGSFTRLGGHRRRHVAAIDLRSGRLTAWNPKPDGPVRALAFFGGRVYLGGSFRHVDGRSRTNLAAVDASDGRVQPWQPRADAPVTALAVIAGTIYAGGDFTSISGAPRRRVAALDAASGAPTAWNPGADGKVSELLATPAGLVAGGRFSAVAGTSQTGFAIFPPTGQPPATASNHPPRWLSWRASAIDW